MAQSATPPFPLVVTWTVERSPSERRLQLRWQESGAAWQEQERSAGFGTKLIDMNITRELKGKITRDFCDGGVSIDIDIPLDREIAR